MHELVNEYSLGVVRAYMTHIQTCAEMAVREMLKYVVNLRNSDAFEFDLMPPCDVNAREMMLEIHSIVNSACNTDTSCDEKLENVLHDAFSPPQLLTSHSQTSPLLSSNNNSRSFSLKEGLPEVGTARAEDFLDDGTPIRLAVTIGE
jgi:hypothetical protein